MTLHRRIGWSLQERRLGVRTHRGAPGGEIDAVDQGRGDAEARQQILYDIETRAEQRLGRDDVVACSQLAHQRGGHGRHATRGRARGPCAFQQRHPALEHRHRRIGETRIDEAAVLALEARLGLLHRIVEIALREKQRLRSLFELRAHSAAVDELRGGTQCMGTTGLAGTDHDALLNARAEARERAKNRRFCEIPDLLALCLTWRQADRLK